jgi:hypothetical protein
MPHLRRAICRPRTLLVAVAAALLLCAAPAAAAPPVNDTPETATDLTTFPFMENIAIAEAGTEPFDAKTLRKYCGTEAAEGTVWYHFKAPTDGMLTFNVTTPDQFDAGVALVNELPASRKSLRLCGQSTILGEVEAGDEFWLAAISRTPSPTGTMTVSANFRPSQPFTLSVDSVSADAQADTVTVSGTYQCSLAHVEFGWIRVLLNPRRRDAGGSGEIDITECSGQPEPFTIEVAPDSGELTGHVTVAVDAAACDDIGCDRAEQSTRIKVAH